MGLEEPLLIARRGLGSWSLLRCIPGQEMGWSFWRSLILVHFQKTKSWERADAVSPPRCLTAANPDSPRVLTVSCWGDRRKKGGLKNKVHLKRRKVKYCLCKLWLDAKCSTNMSLWNPRESCVPILMTNGVWVCLSMGVYSGSSFIDFSYGDLSVSLSQGICTSTNVGGFHRFNWTQMNVVTLAMFFFWGGGEAGSKMLSPLYGWKPRHTGIKGLIHSL